MPEEEGGWKGGRDFETVLVVAQLRLPFKKVAMAERIEQIFLNGIFSGQNNEIKWTKNKSRLRHGDNAPRAGGFLQNLTGNWLNPKVTGPP